jgi:HEAT repeat protein
MEPQTGWPQPPWTGGDPNAPPKDLADALTMLMYTWPHRQGIAAEWLATTPVDPGRQAEVAQALNPLLDWPEAQEQALKALGRWATRDNVPALARLLNDPTGKGWRSALEILSKFKDNQAAVAAVAEPTCSSPTRPAPRTG